MWFFGARNTSRLSSYFKQMATLHGTSPLTMQSFAGAERAPVLETESENDASDLDTKYHHLPEFTVQLLDF